MNRPQTFTKVDLTPRRHHGYAVVLFIFGTLFPPLAVAARFGIGSDFWLNLFLCIAGYIPSHVHNFYIQNIRNNKNNRRTPKWASRYGLVDTSEIERKKKKSQWATRYSERLPNSTLEGQEYEEGQTAGRSLEDVNENGRAPRSGALWTEGEEAYYGRADQAGSSASLKSTASAGRWHYPANFEDAEPLPEPGGKKKKVKKDRWARAEDARMGVGMDDGPRKKKKKKKSRAAESNGDFIDPSRRSLDSSVVEGPEDPEAGHYGTRRHEPAVNGIGATAEQGDGFDHQF